MLKRTAVRAAPWFVVIGVLGVLAFDRIAAVELDALAGKRSDAVVRSRNVIANQLASLHGDLVLLSQHWVLKEAIESGIEGQIAPVQNMFRLVMDIRQSYDQVRLIDRAGMERVRCDWVAENSMCRGENELQSKADRYYFMSSIDLAKGDIYVSRLDLNMEFGRIEQPEKPVLRVATPLVDDNGRTKGIVIVNARMRGMLDAVERVGRSAGAEVYLTDGEGHWLVGERPGDAFARDRGDRANTLPARFPDVASALRSGKSETGVDADGAWSFEAIPVTTLLNAPVTSGPAAGVWWLVAHTPATDLAWIRLRAAAVVLPFALALAGAVLVVAMRFARNAKDRDLAAEALARDAAHLARMNEILKDTLSRMTVIQQELVDERKLSSLGLMVAGVAHELNTPVGAALMATTAMRRSIEQIRGDQGGNRQGARDDRFLRRFDQGTSIVLDNLNRVAERIARLRRVSVDRATEDRRSFRLADLVEDVIRSLNVRISSARLSVERDVPADLTLHSFPGPLGQVLENLIVNAIVHAFDRPVGRVLRIVGLRDGAHALLTVEDNGKGIPETDLGSLFDPFFTTRRGEQRMGLGLFIVHQYVTDVLGAQLSVTSTLGKGTRFSILMPLDVSDADAPDPSTTVAASAV